MKSAGDSFPKLETDRLILRQLRLDEADQQALFGLLSDQRVTRYYNVTPFTNPEQAWAILNRRRRRYWQKRGIRWAITLKDKDTVIGTCGFNSWGKQKKTGELGYELAHQYWNQGIMTEAVRTVITFGFAELALERIEAWIVPENRASANLLIKLGFQSEGIMPEKGYWDGRFHDLELFSLLAEQCHGAKESGD